MSAIRNSGWFAAWLLMSAGPAAGEEGAGERPANDEKATRAIERHIEAVGGRETLEAIRDRTERFRRVKRSPESATKMRIDRFQMRGGKVRERWSIETFQIQGKPLEFVQGYDGKSGWVLMMDTLQPLQGKPLEVFLQQKDDIDDSLLHWKARGYRAEYRGRDTAKAAGKEVPVDVVELAPERPGVSIRCSFSRETGLLVKREWREEVGGRTAHKELVYRDYKDVAFTGSAGKKLKLRVPHRMDIFSDGTLDIESITEEVSLNAGLSEDFFARPDRTF